MSDVDQLEGRCVYATRLYGMAFAVLVTGYFALLAFTPDSAPELPGLLIGFAVILILSQPFLLVLISRHIDRAAGRPRSIVADLKVFFLTIFMYIGFPMVQQNMNDLIVGQNGRT